MGPRTVVLCYEKDQRDANYSPLQENWERVHDMRLEDGSKLDVVPLPMPSPVCLDGQRLSASYANFYVSNAAVLVPTFNDPQDRIALATLANFSPIGPWWESTPSIWFGDWEPCTALRNSNRRLTADFLLP